MEHSNQSASATTMKNNISIQANAMNISAKFQLDPTFTFSVAMATNQIQQFGQKRYIW